MLTPLPLSGSLEQHRSSGSTSLCGVRGKGRNKLYLTFSSTFEMVMLSSVIILQVDRGTEMLAEPNVLKHQQRIHVVGIKLEFTL